MRECREKVSISMFVGPVILNLYTNILVRNVAKKDEEIKGLLQEKRW